MEKNKALDAAMAQIERAFGKGSIMRMGQRSGTEQIEVIPSGSLGLDLALGVGGLPRGGRTKVREAVHDGLRYSAAWRAAWTR